MYKMYRLYFKIKHSFTTAAGQKKGQKITGLNDLSVMPPLPVVSTVYCITEMFKKTSI